MDKETLKDYGINVDAYGCVGSKKEGNMAMDAALLTTPNMGVPVEALTFFDDGVVKILTDKRVANKIFDERKFGTRVDLYRKFKQIEDTGYTQPYSDHSDNGKSDVNINYPVAENYLFETVIEVGDLEQEMSAKGKVNLWSAKQEAAATNIAIDFNRFYMTGVAGLQNYGILNNPDLPSAIVAGTGAASSTLWSTKTGAEIYADIVALMADMSARAGGHVDMTTRYKLIVGPSVYPYLAQQNALGSKTVLGQIQESFPNLEVVVAPEYDDSTKKIQLIAVEVEGVPTGELGFSEKLNAGRVVQYLSHVAQKFSAGTYGAVIYRPIFISTMTGI